MYPNNSEIVGSYNYSSLDKSNGFTLLLPRKVFEVEEELLWSLARKRTVIFPAPPPGAGPPRWSRVCPPRTETSNDDRHLADRVADLPHA